MSLQIAPEIETAVRQYAEREGVSPEELLRRAFPPITAASSVQALLQQWQQEYGLPPRPDGKVSTSAKELFAQWEAEDAELTFEEAAADQEIWADYQTARQRVSI